MCILVCIDTHVYVHMYVCITYEYLYAERKCLNPFRVESKVKQRNDQPQKGRMAKKN